MCGWVMTIGETLMPVIGMMRSQLPAGTYIQANETPVDVQTHDGTGANDQAYLWQKARCNSSETSKGFFKRMHTRPTMAWMVRRWYRRRAGATPDVSGVAGAEAGAAVSWTGAKRPQVTNDV